MSLSSPNYEVPYFLTCNFEKLMFHVLLVFFQKRLLALQALYFVVISIIAAIFLTRDSVEFSIFMELGQK